MAFWDFLRNGSSQTAFFTPRVEYVGGPGWDDVVNAGGFDVRNASAAVMWRTQPHLRTVVSFLARNVAQLGLQTFERLDDTDRKRDRTSPVAVALRQPDTSMTAYDLVFALVGDMALYDTAYWMLMTRPNGAPGLRRLPPSWVSEIRDNPFEVKAYRITRNNATVDVPADQVLAFSGYAPSTPGGVSPTIAALKETLQEQIEASRFRNQIWKRGGRVSSVIERPAGSPAWSDAARESFRDDWYAKYTGNGSKAGGTPILEDGMTLKRIDFSASEQQFVEGAKLSFATVASAFHVNPTMVGLLDNANYSNVREFRRMLYGDTLGPLLAQIEDRVNTFLLPMLGMDSSRFYTEFNIAEKLQGSFEEQAAVMQTMVGAPLMTRNEGRAKFNLPAIDGGDNLVTPLNVLVGGQASPTDSGSQNTVPKAAERRLKAAPSAPQGSKAAEVLSAFFSRQQDAVLGKIAAGSEWWDGKRWDRELAADLLPLAHSISETIGKGEAKRLGYTEGDYDPDQTVNFLKAVAARYATTVNETTKGQLDDALAADDGDPATVFTVAKDSRSVGVGSMLTTFAAGFATVEAAKQIARGRDETPTKTWLTGPNPRPEHASMDGETVPIDEPFSDGNDWPGGEPGCNCSVSTSFS